MAKQKKRRTRSSHPGVVVFRAKSPGRPDYWRARWSDPETGRWQFMNLTKLGLSSEERRTGWAIDKSKALQKRLAEIASGAPKETRTPLADAVDAFFESAENRLRPHTITSYRESIEDFTEWAAQHGIGNIEKLEGRHLAAFREDVVARRRRVPRKGRGSGRGRKLQTDGAISPSTRNSVLLRVSAFLNSRRRLGQTPRLSRDVIGESLARLPVPRPQIEPLKPAQLKAILEAAIRHDAVTYAQTRAEHDGDRAKGTTPRFARIAPLVTAAMLTGCRVSELLNLPWSAVDLDAPDDNGDPAGEIHLRASATKTHTARTILLEVSPRLRQLLLAMKLQADGEPYVFGGDAPMPSTTGDAARDRLVTEFGAPPFSYQALRRTCGSYLANARGVFGAASAYMAARQLGHSIQVAERHYLGLVRGIPREARTLDAAMAIESALDSVVAVARRTASPVHLPLARAVRVG